MYSYSYKDTSHFIIIYILDGTHVTRYIKLCVYVSHINILMWDHAAKMKNKASIVIL